jgi:hypothetical protein
MARTLLLLLLLLLGLATPLRADEEPAAPDVRARIGKWIEDLRADAFGVRETARQQLKQYGLKARDLLEAAKDDEDPEVRRTIRGILDGAGGTPRVPVAAQVADGRFDDVHLVTMEVGDATLEDALRALGEQIGARFEVPESARGTRVTLRAGAEPPFAVLRRLLALGGLRMPEPFDRAGVGSLVLAGDAPTPPWAASGPILVEATELTVTRPLAAKAPPRYILTLRMQWIPLVQIAQYGTPRVTKAEDAQGHAFVAGAAMARQVGYGVGSTRQYADVHVHLEPASETFGDALACLEITLPINSLQHDRGEIVLADASRAPVRLGIDGQEALPGAPESVLFESLSRPDDGRGQWVADLVAVLAGEVAQRTLEAALVEAGGRRHPLHVAGGRSRAADGTVRLTARAYGLGSALPKGIRVAWYRREESGTIAVRLTDVPLR